MLAYLAILAAVFCGGLFSGYWIGRDVESKRLTSLQKLTQPSRTSSED